MADKKTTQETLRTPIDGTELVRLATTGANWQAPLSNIFSTLGGGGGGAAAPQFAIQFNNPLGTLDGSDQALFNPSVGMTLGGATESSLAITPGTGAHLAVGNYAVVDFLTYFPGDPTREETSTLPAVLTITEHYLTPAEDISNFEARGISLTMGFVNRTGHPCAFVGYLSNCSINSDNTDNIGDFVEMELSPTNYNQGNTARMAVVLGMSTNSSPGHVENMYIMKYDANHSGSGTVAQMYGIDLSVGTGFSAGLVDQLRIVRLSAFSGPSNVDILFGLDIEPTAAIGQTSSYNIVSRHPDFSADTLSTLGGNMFQGHSCFGTHADVDANYAVLIDNNSHLNLKSAGATSLNVFDGIIRFGTATNVSPQNGDVWFDGTNLKLRTGGATKTFTVS